MIKNILILTYILVILGVSGFAKASTVTVENASYDSRLLKLSLNGKLSDRCDHKLEAKVVETSSDKSQLSVVIEVVNKNPVKACGLMANSQSEYDLILDVRSLPIPAGSNFKLVIANQGSESLEEISIKLPKTSVDHTANISDLKGQVVLMGNGEYALVKANKQFFVIKSTIDLSKYVGQVVNVSGIEFVHQVGPIIEVNTLDPLDVGHELNVPSMFVLSISTTPQE